jgi:hypothetical protein
MKRRLSKKLHISINTTKKYLDLYFSGKEKFLLYFCKPKTNSLTYPVILKYLIEKRYVNHTKEYKEFTNGSKKQIT